MTPVDAMIDMFIQNIDLGASDKNTKRFVSVQPAFKGSSSDAAASATVNTKSGPRYILPHHENTPDYSRQYLIHVPDVRPVRTALDERNLKTLLV